MEIILAIATILGGITALWFFWDKRKESKGKSYSDDEVEDEAKIKVHVPELINDQRLSFGMLHVRDGKDQISDHGPLLNKEIYPLAVGEHLKFSTNYSRRLGFQFKCFVDYRNMAYEEAKELLESSGFSSISSGGGKSARAWFILPKYEVCATSDGFTNNYYYPA